MEHSKQTGSATNSNDKRRVLTCNFDDVLLAEHRDIVLRRSFTGHVENLDSLKSMVERGQVGRELHRGEPKSMQDILLDRTETYARASVFETVGLALSGGGIRSGSFALGALQAIASKDLFKRIDYLSTVSGGGYTGIASTIAMNANSGVFPFESPDGYHDTQHMRLLRDNANYLKFGKAVPMLHNLAVLLRGMVTNLVLALACLSLLAGFTLLANPDIASLTKPGFAFANLPFPWLLQNSPFGFSILFSGLAVATFLAWAAWKGVRNSFERFGDFLSAGSSFLLVVLAIVAFFELQPWMQRLALSPSVLAQNKTEIQSLPVISCASPCSFLMGDRVGDFLVKNVIDACDETGTAKTPERKLCEKTKKSKEAGDADKSLANKVIALFQSIIAPLLAAAALAARQLAEIRKANETKSGMGAFLKRSSSKLILTAAMLALPLLLWITYHRLVYWGLFATANDRIAAPNAPGWLSFLAAHSHVSNVMYAYSFTYLMLGLAGVLIAFFAMLNPNSNSLHGLYRTRLANAFCVPFAGKRDLAVSKLRAENAPIHIVNATLNIQAAKAVNERGRDAEFFFFTRNYVGSKITGFATTPAYEKTESALDLPTAMAISGAAASSNMGGNMLGRLRFTLALLNVRLGAWMRNPRGVLDDKKTLDRPVPTYFLQELLGKLNESSRLIYLTDGGHIENLGAYELLRRRNKLIIIVEAEADPDMTFSALATLQRYARIDLGARIEISRSCIAPEPEDGAPRSPGPRVHCALGKIDYGPDASNAKLLGTLLYVKASLSGDENDYIKDYQRRNREFPQETTADQFFDEEQFEVYRALGFHAMDGALTGKHLVQTAGNRLESLLDQGSTDERVLEFRRLLGLKPSLDVPAPVTW